MCEEAQCPNVGECWDGGEHGTATATIMVSMTSSYTLCVRKPNVGECWGGGEHGTATATIMVSMISSYTLCVRKPNVPMLGSAGVVGTWYCYCFYHGEYDIKLHTVCEEAKCPNAGVVGNMVLLQLLSW